MVDFSDKSMDHEIRIAVEALGGGGEKVEVPEDYVHTVATMIMKNLLGMRMPADKLTVSVNKERPVVRIMWRESKVLGARAYAQDTDCAKALHYAKESPEECAHTAAIMFERALSESLRDD